MKEIRTNYFWNIVFLYILIPEIIFFCGWTKWYISIPMVIACVYAYYTWNVKQKFVNLPPLGNNKTKVLLVIVLIMLWTYFSGVGGFVWQNTDHYWRNEIFALLVQEKWPVVMDSIDIYTGAEKTTMLSYYIAFWLPAAVVGKLFGIKAGFAFQYLWLVAGVYIVFELLSAFIKKYSVTSFVTFIFFSGLDILGLLFTRGTIKKVPLYEHIEWWMPSYQYSSNTTLLFWVFNQAIYAWIITLMILQLEDNRHIVLIYASGLLACTIPFVGMMPLALFKFVDNLHIKENGFDIKRIVKESLTIENVLAGGLVGIVSYLYLKSNSSAQMIGGGHSFGKIELFYYLVFLLFEIGLYIVSVFEVSYRKPLFWLSLLSLMVCPLLRVGVGSDFCMRASIPALLVLYLCVVEAVETYKSSLKRLRYVFLVTLLLVGSVTPIHEFVRTGVNTFSYAQQNKAFVECVGENEIMGAPNFSADINDSVFYKYVSRR